MWGNSTMRYGAVAMSLHWLIAAAIRLFMFWLGPFMANLPETDPRQFPLFQLHKSIGLTILVLTLARLAWRLLNPVPDLPPACRPGALRRARSIRVLRSDDRRAALSAGLAVSRRHRRSDDVVRPLRMAASSLSSPICARAESRSSRTLGGDSRDPRFFNGVARRRSYRRGAQAPFQRPR